MTATLDPVPLIFDLSAISSAFDMAFETAQNLTVNGVISFDFDFGVDLASERFFLSNVSASAQLQIDAPDIDAALRIGAADLAVSDGSLAATVDVAISLVDQDDTDGLDRITIADLRAAPPATLIDASLSGNGSLVLPVEASFLPIGNSETITVSLAGDLDPGETTVSFAPGSLIEDVARLSAADFEADRAQWSRQAAAARRRRACHRRR